MRGDYGRKELVCGVLFILFAFCILLFLPVNTYAYTEDKQYFSPKQYTESDNLLNGDGTSNIDRNIRDFAYDVKYYSSYHTPIAELGNVIPLQYLESQEENAVFAYNGEEYGFYVSKTNDCFDVLLIDFTPEYKEGESHSDLEYRIRIKPILQQSFQRVVEDGNYVFYKLNNLGYTYYLANPRFSTELLNENALNYGDEGYSKYSDEGLIINQIRVNYRIGTTQDKEVDGGAIAVKALFDISCAFLDLCAPGSGTVINILANATESAGKFLGEEEVIIYEDNENNIETSMSKTAQLLDESIPSFSRLVGFEIKNKYQDIFFSETDDAFIEFIVVLNDINYKSRMIQICDFDIVRQRYDTTLEKVTDANDNETFSYTKERHLFNDRQPTFEIDSKNFESESVPIYLLPRGKQEVTFTPQYSGIYNFELPSNTEMLLNGVSKTSFALQAGETYKFQIVNIVNTRIISYLRCNVERYEDAKTYDVSANEDCILCYCPTDNEYKKVTLSNSYINIGLIDEDMNELVFADSNGFSYNFIQGRKYYFIISNNTNAVLQTSVIISSLDEMSVGMLLDNLFSNQVVSFTNKYPTTVYYKLVLTNKNNILVNNEFRAVVVNKFNTVLSNGSEPTENGIEWKYSLAANETCYIQFIGNLDDVKAEITVCPTQCVWKIGDGIKQDTVTSTKKLKPNSNYSIEMDMYIDGIKIDTLNKFQLYNFGLDCALDIGYLKIGNIANDKYFLIVPREAPDYGLTILVDDMITKIRLMHCDETQDFDEIEVEFGKKINGVTMPIWLGRTFLGYFDAANKQYIDQDMQSLSWDVDEDNAVLYAHWEKKKYTVTFYSEGDVTLDFSIVLGYDDRMPTMTHRKAPSKTGYSFVDYYGIVNGVEEVFYEMVIVNDEQGAAIQGGGWIYIESMKPVRELYHIDGDITLYARFKLLECDYVYEKYAVDGENYEYIGSSDIMHLKHGVVTKLELESVDGYEFDHFGIGGQTITQTIYDYTPYLTRSSADENKTIYPKNWIVCYYTKKCVAAGTLITLADGTQVPVESLKGDEMLLVWNMITGRLDAARIMFVDTDKAATCKVINLGFSDGTTVKIISEHGFWDYDLNQFVYLRSDASKYIGHWFNKGDTRVQLTSVEVRDEYTAAYSPVTYGHLCYYVNGMLSMPGGIDGLFNIFEVDPDTMTVNAEAMARDIAAYGLFTYDEFVELVPVTEDVFNAFNGQYLKVAIGKGLITIEKLGELAERYRPFFDDITSNA